MPRKTAAVRRRDTDTRGYTQDSQDQFRLMVEAVLDYGIFMLDATGHVASWNAGAERIKGYRREEILGRHFSVFYPPEQVAAGWPDHELEMARGSGRFEDEGWRIRKDGSRFWANVVITAMHDPTGVLRGFAKITRDLTESKRMETLEQEGQQINEFLAMLGHELRNPLAPIRNAVAVMAAREVSDPTMLWAREVIERQVGHLSRLVDDLLDVSRITRGKINLHRDVIDFAAVVSRAVEATLPLLEQRHHAVEVDVGRDPMRLDGDSTRLTQVILNLLSNAAKFTPQGGHIWVRLTREGDEAVLSVRDDGIGMSAELVPHVFDLFIQGQRGLDRSEGGLGIGLTMVQRLVALHGGTVAARSPGPGHGSEFIVRLPLTEIHAAEPSPVADVPPKPAAGPRLRVLVVDDSEDSVESLAMLLRLWGHDVMTATDGATALDLVSQKAPHVVLLDIGLPGLSGYEVAKRIRAREGGQDIVLVALTGYGQADDRRRAKEAGFTVHLVKPVVPETLQRLLAGIEPTKESAGARQRP
ncbi:MAG TPA: ATP-binding protein [Vicinamibacteria bacterium]|nr:ATP-binding protein [Vicinamibacteria bacterium]